MSGFLAIMSRELRAYFYSPMAYVILTFFLLLNGHFFMGILDFVNDPRFAGDITPMEPFFQNTWLFLLFITPMLTMRLLSEERRSGTIEMLLTAPVSETQVVLGKYLAVVLFYMFLWLPTLIYVGVIAYYGSVDWGPVASGYLGVAALGAFFLAIGVFASSFTKNQVVAGVISFSLLLVLLTVFFIIDRTASGIWQDVLGYVNIFEHLDELGRGIVDSRRLIYYFTTAALFLFFAARTLAAKKWR